MKCKDALRLIDATLDGEARRLDACLLNRHLATCRDCAARRDAAATLSARLRAELPRHAAPEALRARAADLFATVEAAPRTAPRWPWFAGGALAGCAATLAAWMIGTAAIDMRVNADVAVEAVTSHVRATLGNHLIQVASSDQHTVKPWLSARLDYSPPVPDLRAEGFTLLGGRVDYLDGRPVATLVYRIRDHMIDVYVRPQAPRHAPPALRTLRGFHVAHATGADMDWLAVSDLSADALTSFADALARDAGAP
jgi:anti-sigma factor RsiW